MSPDFRKVLNSLDVVVQTAPPVFQRTGRLVSASAGPARAARKPPASRPAARRENTGRQTSTSIKISPTKKKRRHHLIPLRIRKHRDNFRPAKETRETRRCRSICTCLETKTKNQTPHHVTHKKLIKNWALPSKLPKNQKSRSTCTRQEPQKEFADQFNSMRCQPSGQWPGAA